MTVSIRIGGERSEPPPSSAFPDMGYFLFSGRSYLSRIDG
jgi:hypothetical protein